MEKLQSVLVAILMVLLCFVPIVGAATYTSQYPTGYSDTYVKYSCSYSGGGYEGYRAFNPATSLTGITANNVWMCQESTNQRVNADLGSAKIIRQVYYQNYHHNGVTYGRGLKDFTLWGSNSNDAFLITSYSDNTGWTQLTTNISSLVAHPESDSSYPRYIDVSNTVAYRYYSLKAANNYGDTTYMGIRRVELQTEDGYGSEITPVASFTKDKTGGTSPVTVVFTDTSTNTPTSWYWVFGDGSSTNSTVQSPVHTFTGAGTYNVNLTATNGAGSDTTATQAIVVGVAPTSSFTKSGNDGTSPYTVIFTDTSTGTPTSWNWVFGDGSSVNATVQSPVHTFTGAGTYNVNLTASNSYGIGSTTATQAIVVGVAPVSTFSKDLSIGAVPLTVIFTFTGSGATSYNWTFSDGSLINCTEMSPVHTFSLVGVYAVSVNATNAYGSTISAGQNVDAGNDPVSSFSVNISSGYVFLPVEFHDTSTNAPDHWGYQFKNETGIGVNTSWVWFTTDQNPIWSFGIGNFSIRSYNGNDYGHNLSTQITFINVSPLVTPPTNAHWTVSVPSGTLKVPPTWQQVWFNATSDGGTPTAYAWDMNGYTFPTPVQNEQVSFNWNGTFWFNLTVLNMWGSSTYNQTYTVLGSKPSILGMNIGSGSGVFSPPTPDILFDVTYDDMYGLPPTSYLWNFGDGHTMPYQTCYHHFDAVGNFTITVTETNAWGSDTHTLYYVVLPVPPQAVATAKWVDSNGATITSAYTGVNVSYVFDTVGKGINPPVGYIADQFSLHYYKKDPSTGNWIEESPTLPVYAMISGGTVFVPYSAGVDFSTNGGTSRWVGYIPNVQFLLEQDYRITLKTHNNTGYATTVLITKDISIINNPVKFSNLGGWADSVGGTGLKLIIAALIVLGLIVAPYILMRTFNPYIEVIMAVLGLGFCYYLGLIDLWIIFGLGVIAAVVIFFMSRGGGGGAVPIEAGGEMG